MLQVILCKNYNKSKEIAKEIAPCGAIECEYGEDTIDENTEGVKVAMYHHGQHSDKPAPSVRWDVFEELDRGLDNFIISHIDLDTIIGIMWASKILRPTNIAKEIGRLAELQDLNGFHYIEREILHKLKPTIKYRFLGAGYILSNISMEDNGEDVIDVSRIVHKSILKIKDIIIEGVSPELKEKIDFWLQNKKEEARKNLKYENQVLNFYVSDKNLSSAYCTEEGVCKDINLQYNTSNNSITLAVFNEEIAKDYFGEEGVLKPLKDFFGEKAGGRISIGGGPRDKKLTLQHANAFLEYLLSEYINMEKKAIKNVAF